MKIKIELDEAEIKQSITEHLDEQGFKVVSLFVQHFGQGTDTDPIKYMASAMVEAKGKRSPHAERDEEEGL